jgi:hypothetical protein
LECFSQLLSVASAHGELDVAVNDLDQKIGDWSSRLQRGDAFPEFCKGQGHWPNLMRDVAACVAEKAKKVQDAWSSIADTSLGGQAVQHLPKNVSRASKTTPTLDSNFCVCLPLQEPSFDRPMLPESTATSLCGLVQQFKDLAETIGSGESSQNFIDDLVELISTSEKLSTFGREDQGVGMSFSCPNIIQANLQMASRGMS